jgi:hypothetical protein
MYKHDIIAITVSTNYDDLLKIVIPQNAKFFKKWIIITKISDTKTINVVKESNCNNIELLYYDFHLLNGKKTIFNKGGAVRYGQEHVYKNKDYNDNVIIILDSDIILPNNFATIVNKINIENDKLYGSSKRHDYWSGENFKNNIIDYEYLYCRHILGYFQMYKCNPTYLYNNSSDCSTCDKVFTFAFKRLIIIENLEVKHLGKAYVNWKGRGSHNDFKTNKKL